MYIYRKTGCEYPFCIGNHRMRITQSNNSQPTIQTKQTEPASSSPLAGRLVGWLAPDTKNSFKLTYVMIWQQKHVKAQQNITKHIPNLKSSSNLLHV